MKVLIADKFEKSGLDGLKASGCNVIFEPDLKDDALTVALNSHDPSVLVVRSTKVTSDMVKASDGLALILRAGAGYNTIDVEAASARGIAVANCPGKNAVAVAELAMGLILALDRRIADNTAELRAGKWNKKEFSNAPGLMGRTLGVIGVGEIGRALIARAKAFEMDVVAWSRSLTPEAADELDVRYAKSVAEVAEQSDIVSLHVAAAAETKNLINAQVLAKMKAGAYLINTSRADVVDYDALANAVKEKNLRVGLDVYPNEPSAGVDQFRPAIFETGGVICGTHHIGASTDQAQEAIAAEAVRVVSTFNATGQVLNCVNIETQSAADCQIVVRHYDKVGVLAYVLDRLREVHINVQEMSNTIFQGSKAAVATMRLDKAPPAKTIADLVAKKEDIIQVQVKSIN
jgi:D-3-phosphoglycerate dehydrogenase / 2-oxoglutarate reductase